MIKIYGCRICVYTYYYYYLLEVMEMGKKKNFHDELLSLLNLLNSSHPEM